MASELSDELGMSVKGERGGTAYIAELQRGRLLSATFTLVGKRGYEGMSARRVSERAGVSNRTFYELFRDREDCFLAAFNYAVDILELEVRAGWESKLGWTARIRAALKALLVTLDREPAVRRLVVVEALAAGPPVLSRRARVLEALAGVIDQGRANAKAPAAMSPLVAEGVVGATLGVIHARLLELRPEPLIELLSPLMATIVLPYRGSTAAARELARPTPRPPVYAACSGESSFVRPLGVGLPVDYRLTVRAQMALAAVAGRPGLNNREVSEVVGLADQGEVSRMMKRLQEQGLVENAQAHAKRLARAWRLTADGEAVVDAHRLLKRVHVKTRKGGKLLAKSGRRGEHQQIATVGLDVGFRLTVLTREVLMAVGEMGARGPGPSNREVAAAVGVKDEGQTSKLLARLQTHGLLENAGGHAAGENAWRLTPRGEELLLASRPGEEQTR